MTARQRELKLSDYLEHMMEASELACNYVRSNLSNFPVDETSRDC
jgi:hypothetical protein